MYILFDADGVVIHAELFSKQYAREFGISTEDMLPFFLGDFWNCLIGKADLKEVIIPRLPKRRRPWTVDEFLAYWFSHENHPDLQLLSYIQEVRKKWIICSLATNQEQWRTSYMKTTMQFDTLFDHVFSSAYLGVKKPNPAYFHQIISALEKEYTTKISPHDILFFDDTHENIDQAIALGINAYVYQWIDQTRVIINTHL